MGEFMQFQRDAKFRILFVISLIRGCLIKMFASGTSEVFATFPPTQRGRKRLRFSLTNKCVSRYGSNLRKFIFNVCVGNLPIVQWQPPPLPVVEAVALHSVDAPFLVPLRLFHHEAPYLLFFTNMFELSFGGTHQAMIFCNYYNKQCHHLQSSSSAMLRFNESWKSPAKQNRNLNPS